MEMLSVLDLSVAVVAVRALGISRGVFRYLELSTTTTSTLRGTNARSRIYQQLAAEIPRPPPDYVDAVTCSVRAPTWTRWATSSSKRWIPIAVSVVLAFAAVGILLVHLGSGRTHSGCCAGGVRDCSALAVGASCSTRRPYSSAAAARFSESAVTALDHSAELRVSGRLDQAVSEKPCPPRTRWSMQPIARRYRVPFCRWPRTFRQSSCRARSSVPLLIGIARNGTDRHVTDVHGNALYCFRCRLSREPRYCPARQLH